MRPPVSRRTVGVGAAVLLLALLAGALLQARTWNDHRQQSAARADAVATAERVAVGMTSLSGGASKAALARFGQDLTETLRRQLLGPSGQLSTMLRTAKVTSQGKALEAGLVAMDARSARVVVGVDASVTNASAPQGEVRRYRMLITLQRAGGTWRADTVELVP